MSGTPKLPRRLQLRRTRGWRKLAGAIVCARPGRWGNPYSVKAADPNCLVASREEAVHRYRMLFTQTVLWEWRREARRLLAGRDLYCWCPLTAECHVDFLLALANDWDLRGDVGSGARRRAHDDWLFRQTARRAFLEVIYPDAPIRRLTTYLSVPPMAVKR